MLKKWRKTKKLEKAIPKEVVTMHEIVPLKVSKKSITVAMHNKNNLYAIDIVKFVSGLNVVVKICSKDEIKKIIEKHYKDKSWNNYNENVWNIGGNS